MKHGPSNPEYKCLAEQVREQLADRSVVLVGLMGAGKTTIGRRLANHLHLDFCDADDAVEEAAGMSISDIFATYGEKHFRDGERKVIERILSKGPQVLATGGGAFMNMETRENIAKKGISVWLKVDLETLLERVGRRNHRPLLNNTDHRTIMQNLIDERYPVYAIADVTVTSNDRNTHEDIVAKIIRALADFM
jgi:shikimate kinase